MRHYTTILPEARSQAGVTLVELMVAAAVLGLALTATVSMLRTGMDLEHQYNLERQAYNLAYASLENPAYTYPANYDTIPDFTTTITLYTGAQPVNVNVTVHAHPEIKERTWVAHPETPWRRVDAKVAWHENGVARSIIATKIIARIQ
ncbi:MAG TPA: prepilin-type N-terminal cleavage/methylation domain-containing protein [Fibrobacteria bacterium]|nr:prepilin-type N-terminal cleavage/methylation domain-containing protein [Fibrobacteria bacterium]